MMDLYQMEAFVAVAQEHSFSRAALRLHRTQSAVSQTIGKLEDTLGEKVFERSSRDGTLTAAGQVLLEYAEELLNLRERARDAITELRSLHEGKLTVAANEFTSLCLLPTLHLYHRMHPSIKIQVQRTLAGDVSRLILTHQVEFGVLSFKPEDEQLSSTIFYRDELVFVVYPGHSLASAEKVSIRDLGAESFVAHNVTSPLRIKVIEAFKQNHTTLHMDVELPTLIEYQRVCAHGQRGGAGAKDDRRGRAATRRPGGNNGGRAEAGADAATGDSQGGDTVPRGSGVPECVPEHGGRPETSGGV